MDIDKRNKVRIGKLAPIRFNIMVVGETGSGKSTFLKTIFRKYLSEHQIIEAGLNCATVKTVFIERIGKFSLPSENQDCNVHLFDSPGYGDYINNQNAIETVRNYLEKAHQDWLELNGNMLPESERNEADGRIHCLFYFIAPHRFKDIDREFIKQLTGLAPIVPVIAKADTMTLEERKQHLLEVRRRLVELHAELHTTSSGTAAATILASGATTSNPSSIDGFASAIAGNVSNDSADNDIAAVEAAPPVVFEFSETWCESIHDGAGMDPDAISGVPAAIDTSNQYLPCQAVEPNSGSGSGMLKAEVSLQQNVTGGTGSGHVSPLPATSNAAIPLDTHQHTASTSFSVMQYADHQNSQDRAEGFTVSTPSTIGSTSSTNIREDCSRNTVFGGTERLVDHGDTYADAPCVTAAAVCTEPVFKVSGSEVEAVDSQQTTPSPSWDPPISAAASVQQQHQHHQQQHQHQLGGQLEQHGEELVHSHAYQPIAAGGSLEPIAVHSSLLQPLPKVRNIFAVVCDVSPSGKRVYPWGSLDVNNEEHSDFRRLQRLLFEDSHIVQLREAAHALSMRKLRQTAFKARLRRSGRAHGQLVQALALLRDLMKLLSHVFALLGWVMLVVLLVGYAASGADLDIFSGYCSRCVSLALQLYGSELTPSSQQAHPPADATGGQ